MQSHTSVELFLKNITNHEGSIDLSMLKNFNGGGTHAIYRSEKYPDLLLKVMHRTVGKERAELAENLQTLDQQTSDLYETFGESRCIIEKRSIQTVQKNDTDKPQIAIVSIVPFDTCFESKEKFGFNVYPAEREGPLIESKHYLYTKVNRSLLASHEKPSAYVMRNYPQLNGEFEKIFSLLDTNPSLIIAMKEFLTKYKSFYKKTGILLDTIGFDNVIFYKTGDTWQFKLGSVIKHDTSALTKKTLGEIIDNPAIVNKSFEAFTAIYFMPACIRAINACAEKVGLEKIIDDINIDEKTIDALSKIHLESPIRLRIINYAKHEKFSTALALYRQIPTDEKSDITEVRDGMGTSYWNFIKKGGKEKSREEFVTYLNLLLDKRNSFPDFRKKMVEEAIEGLQKKLLLIDTQKTTNYYSSPSLRIGLFYNRTKLKDESDKQFVCRMGSQRKS